MWTILGAWSDGRAADRELRSLRRDLGVRSMLEGEGIDSLTASAGRFEAISDRLGTPLLAPVRVMPFVGRQLSAASHQADAAAAGLRAAADISGQLKGLVDSSVTSGPARVAALRQVGEVAKAGRGAFENLDLGPDRALLGQLGDARARIEADRKDALELLDRAAAMSAGLATFFEGPSDYLLLAANNAQMQNGQGMFLSAGVLHVADGRMDLGGMEPTSDLPPASPPVPLDPDLAARWGWLDPNGDFRHLGLSHRFPVTAETAAALWAATGRPAVDGVLVVDPYLLRVIMEASGPVSVGSKEIKANAIVAFALHDQYRGYLNAKGEDVSFSGRRRDQLGELAVEAVREFEKVRTVEPAFLERLSQVASGRHLFGWSSDPQVQAGWVAAGIDGQISPSTALLSFVNRSGNKLDWFLRTSADLSITQDSRGYAGELRIRLRNRAPAEGEPAYVVGPYPGSGLVAGQYLGLVTLTLPEGATDIRFDGDTSLAVAGPDGPNRTVATWVRVARGDTVELVARFRLSKGMTTLEIAPSARSSPTKWSFGSVRWTDARGRTVRLSTGR
ncbi:MAG: DUF4012 domain-containing protein [Microthrixaceae bacterium]